MVHSFIELEKAVVHVISLIHFLWLWFSFCPLRDKDKKLMEASWWERLTGWNWVVFWWVGPLLSKSLIQFSVDGRDCVLSLLFDLRPNFGGGNEGDVDSLLPSGPLPCLPRPPPESWTLTGKSGLVSCGITAPFPWVLVCTRFFFVPSKGPFLESCVSSGGSVVGLMVTSSKKAYAAPVCCGRPWGWGSGCSRPGCGSSIKMWENHLESLETLFFYFSVR